MSVDIGEAVQEGIERTVARNGLYFVLITFAIGLLNGLIASSVVRDAFGDVPAGMPTQPPMTAPSLGLSPAVAGLLSLVLGLVSLVVTTAAIRTFVTGETERLPEEHFTRNILLVVVNLIVGGIVFSVVVGIGFVLLVIPGLFLLVSLFFWNVYVIVEDENFVEAFRSAWDLAAGNRISLFLLGVVVVVISVVISAVGGIPAAILPDAVGFVVNQLFSAFAGVFVLATAARAFVQLAREETEPAVAADGGFEAP